MTNSGYGNPVIRFWKRVSKEGPIHPVYGQCWIWTGGKFASGYGVIYAGKKTIKAHRMSWMIHNGSISDEQCVLHKCDNKLCVNPNHLFLGTAADNVLDMVNKDRHSKGINHGHAKVTEEIVREIRARYRWRDPTRNSYTLAQEYGIGQYAVMCILNRKTWNHVV